ncbi:MAG: DUF3015 family protein [Rhodoferax sp.]|nr:DUF3015 family protein [Rhodoferax sp.]
MLNLQQLVNVPHECVTINSPVDSDVGIQTDNSLHFYPAFLSILFERLAMKKFLVSTMFLGIAGGAFAAGENNVGCGLGSAVVGGQSGVVPQVLAVTTNGSFGNQTFGISSGTLGCSKDGTVPKSKMAVMFIEGNQDKLAADMSSGKGESLTGLAHVVGVSPAQQEAFNATLKQNYQAIVNRSDLSAADLQKNMKSVLSTTVFAQQAIQL